MKSKAPERPDPQSEFLTIPQSAAELHISVRGMYRVLKSKDGPPVCRVSPRKVVIRRDDLDAWVKAQSQRRKRSKPSNPNGAVPAPPAS